MSVDIECPRCNNKFTEPLLLPGRIITCPSCGFQTPATEHDVQVAEESRTRVRENRP